jgi:hypothetical protein
VSRWKPSHARARGLPRRDSDPRRDDAEVSRSSRGKKYVVSGKSCRRSEVGYYVACTERRVTFTILKHIDPNDCLGRLTIVQQCASIWYQIVGPESEVPNQQPDFLGVTDLYRVPRCTVVVLGLLSRFAKV